MKPHIPLIIILLALVAFMAIPKIISLIKGPAPTPTMFNASYTLDQAFEQSEQSGKPVLVVVTADWCPPCQALKRGALSNPEVIQWVTTNMIPVYLEDAVNPDQIRTLSVRSFPTTFIIKDGQILSQFPGNTSATNFLKKIQPFSAQP